MKLPLIAYQVSSYKESSGWLSRKHAVRWRFGFADPAAQGYGLIGDACRGKEHEIALDYYSGGRCCVSVDQFKIHDSATSSSGSCSFDLPSEGGCHIITVKAPDKYSIFNRNPQFGLQVDGERFSEMVLVHQLGRAERAFYSHHTSSTNRQMDRIQWTSSNASHLEERMIELAKEMSRKDMPSLQSRMLVVMDDVRVLWTMVGCVILAVLTAAEGGYVMHLASWIRFLMQSYLLLWAICFLQNWLVARRGSAVEEDLIAFD